MTDDRNRTSVLRQLTALQNMKLPKLQEKWRDLYGTEPPNLSRKFIEKRLAYRIQELFYGGLSENANNKLKKHMLELQSKNPINENVQQKVLTGARFIREWHGKRHEVIVRDDGFEYNGQMFRSLTAVAKKITGTKWNGLVFFNAPKSLTQKRG